VWTSSIIGKATMEIVVAPMSAGRPQQQHVEYPRIVVKVGTNVLTTGSDELQPSAMAALVEQIVALQRRGVEVLLVTSGAIAVGRQRVGASDGVGDLHPRDVQARQVFASVGQGRLMALWDELFEQHDVVIAQALLTGGDLDDRVGYLNARNTLTRMVELGVVPIVNENDVVSIEEIAETNIGDNDNLSAQVANLVDADLLLLLTDVAGLYSADPGRDPSAHLLEEVPLIDETIVRAAAGAPGARGTGGMATKVEAARLAAQHGTHVVIADGRARDVVLRAASGEPVGTHFLPSGDRTESRRRYLMSGLQVRGRVLIDDGAAAALRHGGNSLLPAGVTGAEGEFVRGDVVHVYSGGGEHVATGVANYGRDEVERIAGKHSEQIIHELGYEQSEEVIHRNNLVLV
jgi:glutamate 5-kinase